MQCANGELWEGDSGRVDPAEEVGQTDEDVAVVPTAVPTGVEIHLLGPPGTGKTTALTKTWIPRAVEKYGPGGVAVCSLTRAAAQEIASRQVSQLPPERVGTLHSFARAALGQDAFFGEVRLAQTEEALARWNEEVARGDEELLLSGASHKSTGGDLSDSVTDVVSASRKARRSSTQPLTGDEALAVIETLRHRRVPRDDWPEEVDRFWTAWSMWKRERDEFDFTDLIQHAHSQSVGLPLFSEGSGRVRALFVDEAQDCSKLEMALVRHWVTCVDTAVLSGDPNQSIYGFRGAEAGAFHDPETFPAERTYVLGQSYRLPREVQDYAEAWLETSEARVPLTYAPRAARGEVCAQLTLSLAPPVVPRLVRYIADEATALEEVEGDDGRVMVLAPAAFMLKPLLAELRRRGVLFFNPFAQTRGDWNPLRTAHEKLTSLFLGPCPALSGEQDINAGGRPPRLWTWAELKAWTGACTSKGFLLRGVKSNLIAKMAKKQPRGVIDTADLQRIFVEPLAINAELMPMLEDPERHGEALRWYRSRLLAAQQKSLSYAMSIAEGGVHALMQRPRVIVGTIHSVKGGTAGSVIISPDLSSRQKRGLKIDEGFDEMIRLFYVGMTRSSGRLTILAPSRKNRRMGNYMKL